MILVKVDSVMMHTTSVTSSTGYANRVQAFQGVGGSGLDEQRRQGIGLIVLKRLTLKGLDKTYDACDVFPVIAHSVTTSTRITVIHERSIHATQIAIVSKCMRAQKDFL